MQLCLIEYYLQVTLSLIFASYLYFYLKYIFYLLNYNLMITHRNEGKTILNLNTIIIITDSVKEILKRHYILFKLILLMHLERRI